MHVSGLDAALLHGWIEPQDVLRKEELLCRGEAARMMHEFLLRELGEADEEDWGVAKELKDLYDCRVCVRHVAQMVQKGIMQPQDGQFGIRNHIFAEEAVKEIDRLWKPWERLGTPVTEKVIRAGGVVPHRVSMAEARHMMEECGDIWFWDVRTVGEYAAGHPRGAKSFPLLQLLEHPGKAAPDPNAPVFLGCDGGYRSEIAAWRLTEAGFQQVYYFGWED